MTLDTLSGWKTFTGYQTPESEGPTRSVDVHMPTGNIYRIEPTAVTWFKCLLIVASGALAYRIYTFLPTEMSLRDKLLISAIGLSPLVSMKMGHDLVMLFYHAIRCDKERTAIAAKRLLRNIPLFFIMPLGALLGLVSPKRGRALISDRVNWANCEEEGDRPMRTFRMPNCFHPIDNLKNPVDRQHLNKNMPSTIVYEVGNGVPSSQHMLRNKVASTLKACGQSLLIAGLLTLFFSDLIELPESITFGVCGAGVVFSLAGWGLHKRPPPTIDHQRTPLERAQAVIRAMGHVPGLRLAANDLEPHAQDANLLPTAAAAYGKLTPTQQQQVQINCLARHN
jgi:hypothetical protein